VAGFELGRLEFFWKINLDQNIGINENNFDPKYEDT
jgi:hypothetical protein